MSRSLYRFDPKWQEGKRKKMPKSLTVFLEEKANGAIEWSPQQIQYSRKRDAMSMQKRGWTGKSAFCMKVKWWFCIVFRLEIGQSLCYITIRKGDTDVQVSTWDSRKRSRNRRENHSPKKAHRHISKSRLGKEKAIRGVFRKRAPKEWAKASSESAEREVNQGC